MSTTERSALTKHYAVKLSVTSSSILSKADELCRILDSKGSSYMKTLNLTGNSRITLCLDIASSQCGQSVDKKIAQQLSGLSKRRYQRALGSLQTLLGVNTTLSVRECAVRLGCPQLADKASYLLARYMKLELKGDETLLNTTMTMVAVTTVALEEKILISKSKISEMNIDSMKTTKLQNQMQIILKQDVIQSNPVGGDVMETQTPNSRESKKRKVEITKQFNGLQLNTPSKRLMGKTNIEDYETWKRRILERARANVIQ